MTLKLRRAVLFLLLIALFPLAGNAEWLPDDWTVSGGGPSSFLFALSAPDRPHLIELSAAPLTAPDGAPWKVLDGFSVEGEGGRFAFSGRYRAGRVNLSMKGECRPFHGDGLYFSFVFVPDRDFSGLYLRFTLPAAKLTGRAISLNGSFMGKLAPGNPMKGRFASLVFAEGFPEQVSLRFAAAYPGELKVDSASSGKVRLCLDLTRGRTAAAGMPLFITGRISSRDIPPRPYCSVFHVFGEPPFLRYRPFEAAFQFLGVRVKDPYDADSLPVVAAARDEFGQQVLFRPFYYRPLRLDSSPPAPAAPPFFMLRFTPRNACDYAVSVRLGEGRYAYTTPPLRFSCCDSSGGFVIASPDDPHYLMLSSSVPYFPVGFNLAWLKDAKPGDYAAALRKMAKNGVNCTRIWISTWGISAFSASSPFGFDDGALALLDDIFSLCDELGVRVILVLTNHEDLEKNRKLLPFFSKKGATLDSFFRGGPARDAFARAVRYLVDRYGPYASLLAFETGNELDYVAPKDSLAPWTAWLSGLIRSRDPNRHLVTASLGFNAFDSDFWKSSGCDLLQFHAYTRDLAFIEHDYERSAAAMVDHAAALLSPLGKPALIAEFGYAVTEDNPGFNAVDTEGVHLHNALWASLTAGMAGSAMNWWWDTHVFRYDLLYHYRALSRFVEGIDFPAERFLPVRRETADLTLRELRGASVRLGWLSAPGNDWISLASGKSPALTSARVVTLDGFPRGLYRVEWWDTREGRVLSSFEMPIDGSVNLTVPDFERDVAYRITAVRIED